MMNRLRKYSNKLLWVAIFVYILLFCFLSLKKYYLFAYNAYDLAIFNQVFFNTINGNFFAGTVNANIYLADHFTPIIILLLPFYYLKQSSESLLVIQSVFLGLSAWPLYKIALKINKNRLIALSVALLWLFNPYVHSANLFEFHLLPIAVFFIFWAFYFYIKNNFLKFTVFFILAILVREDIALLLLGFFILSYLDRKKLKWKLLTFFLPLMYFFLAMKVISYFSKIASTKFLIYYAWLGGDNFAAIIWSWLSHPIDVFIHIFSFHNLWGIFIILLPLLFLPLINKKYLLFLFIPLMQFSLSSSGINFLIYFTHYILFLLPGIFIALIYSFRDLKNSKTFFGSNIIYNNKKIACFLLLFSLIYFALILSPVRSMLFYDYDQQKIEDRKEFEVLIKKEDRLATQSVFTANLSSREYIYPIHYTYFGTSQFAYSEFKLPPVDKILIDFEDFLSILAERETNFLLRKNKTIMPSNFRKILSEYNLSKAKNNYFLWEAKEKTSRNLKLYEIIDKPINFNSQDFLLKYEKVLNFNEDALRLSFQKNNIINKKYIIRFYRGDYYYDLPLDYGILPFIEWQEDKVYQFYYFPDKDVYAWQIFAWQGDNKLGYIKESLLDIKVEPINDIVFIN